MVDRTTTEEAQAFCRKWLETFRMRDPRTLDEYAEWLVALWWRDGKRLPGQCWCGEELAEKGHGKYPYECGAKDKWPDAMVYQGCCKGHGCWGFDPMKRREV